MDSLRRVSLPLKGTERLRRVVFKPRPPRMGRAERKMEEALNQLNSGVPLNWTQMEDDPELVTLARLYSVARTSPHYGLDSLPPDLQADTLERLSKRLPAPKPEPVKQAPRSLAGFSENVTVLTQAEEDLPQLETTAPQLAVSLVVTALVVTVLALAYNFFFPAPKSPYSWIELRQNGSVISAPNIPKGYKHPVCPAVAITDTMPFALRRYTDFNDKQQAQEQVDFPITYLPDNLTIGGTEYSFSLFSTGISPCNELGSVPFSSAKLSYLVKGTATGGGIQLGQLLVFQGRQQIAPVDNANSTFKQVTIGGQKGVFWESETYRDYSNTLWLGQGPISVLILEKGDLVTTFVGPKDKGITEELLTALVEKMSGNSSPSTTPQAGQLQQPSVSNTPSSNIALPIHKKRAPR